MILRQNGSFRPSRHLLLVFIIFAFIVATANASVGDRLPEFKECVEVCKQETCAIGDYTIPLHRRLLLWTCPQECDYTCQHIITHNRIASSQPIEQFHGKWPFHRFLGMQEPFSVLFSLFNFLVYYNGLQKVRSQIPASYPLRVYYVQLSYINMAAWIFSAIFHTRDFPVTEQLDYFAAGAVVLYGMYYSFVRIFRMDRGVGSTAKSRSILRAWTGFCVLLYIAHVSYLKLGSWDYTYNMAANVAVGIVQNVLWTWFSVQEWRKTKRSWTAWPGLVVAWVVMAMSLELLDFPPLAGALDAHSLWHLGTVAPAVLMYNFLIKDAQDDIASRRLKA